MNVEEMIQQEVNKLNGTTPPPAKSNGGPPLDNGAESMRMVGGQSSTAFREAAAENATRALEAVRALSARVEEIQQNAEKFALETKQRGDELATQIDESFALASKVAQALADARRISEA